MIEIKIIDGGGNPITRDLGQHMINRWNTALAQTANLLEDSEETSVVLTMAIAGMIVKLAGFVAIRKKITLEAASEDVMQNLLSIAVSHMARHNEAGFKNAMREAKVFADKMVKQ